MVLLSVPMMRRPIFLAYHTEFSILLLLWRSRHLFWLPLQGAGMLLDRQQGALHSTLCPPSSQTQMKQKGAETLVLPATDDSAKQSSDRKRDGERKASVKQ